jgi:hypothetical protein
MRAAILHLIELPSGDICIMGSNYLIMAQTSIKRAGTGVGIMLCCIKNGYALTDFLIRNRAQMDFLGYNESIALTLAA